jgi:hypothetical protein
MRKLTPSANMHFKNINTGDIYESDIYLGIYDSADNYVEVTEEEYQEYLAEKEREANENIDR